MAYRTAKRALAVLASAALVLGACGGDDDDDAASTPTSGPEAPAETEPTATEPPAETTVPSAGGGLQAATAVEVLNHLTSLHGRADVDQVELEGATIVIVLSTPDATPDSGLEVCDQAAMVAYAGDVTEIRVIGSDETVLATGSKDGACAAA